MTRVPESVLKFAYEKSYLLPGMVVQDGWADTPLEKPGESPIDAILGYWPEGFAALQRQVEQLTPSGRMTLLCPATVKPEREWMHLAGVVNRLAWQLDGWWVLTGSKRVHARQAVQDAYAAKALEQSGCDCGCGDGGCCSPGDAPVAAFGEVTWSAGYSDAEEAQMPPEAAAFSLGCGNPIGMAGLKPGETVLDIGSGGGLDVFLAAKQVGPTGHAIGIDMTPAMLQLARRTAKQAGITNVTFRHGYAEELPVLDGSVDVIISNCVINLSEDKGAVFAEAFRALKVGGRLEVNDMVFGGAVPPSMRTSQDGWSECVSGALPEQEYVDIVRQAGFDEVRVTRSTSHGVAGGVPVYSVQVSAVRKG